MALQLSPSKNHSKYYNTYTISDINLGTSQRKNDRELGELADSGKQRKPGAPHHPPLPQSLTSRLSRRLSPPRMENQKEESDQNHQLSSPASPWTCPRWAPTGGSRASRPAGCSRPRPARHPLRPTASRAHEPAVDSGRVESSMVKNPFSDLSFPSRVCEPTIPVPPKPVSQEDKQSGFCSQPSVAPCPSGMPGWGDFRAT